MRGWPGPQRGRAAMCWGYQFHRRMLEPYGDLTEEEAFKAFHEQASVLAEGGVDGFIIETMFSLAEAACALRASPGGGRFAGDRLYLL